MRAGERLNEYGHRYRSARRPNGRITTGHRNRSTAAIPTGAGPASGQASRSQPTSLGSGSNVNALSAVDSIGAVTPHDRRRSAAAADRTTIRSVRLASRRTKRWFRGRSWPASTAYARHGVSSTAAHRVAHRKYQSSADVQVSM